MATVEHNTLSDPLIHEPKGASTATAGQVYVADGLGSGAWSANSPSYGEMTITNNSLTFTPIAADLNQYKRLTNTGWADEVSQGIVINADGVNDDITLEAGTYIGTFWASMQTNASNSTLYGFRYSVDGVFAPRASRIQKNSAGTDTILISSTGITVAATAGQKLSVYISSDSTTAVTFIDAGLVLHRIDT